MTTLTRWKLACALFAGIAGVATVKARESEPSNKPAQTVASARGSSLPSHLRRPMRVTPEALGVSKDELVSTMLAARSLRDIQQVAAKLGAVGDDAVIDQISPLVHDARRGVPEAVLGVIGTIGTEHAVEELIAFTKDDRPSVRNAAVSALGATQSAKAEQLLVDLAQRVGHPAQSSAISGLGTLGSDRAVAVLSQIAKDGDYQSAQTATYALGSVGTPASRAVLRKLIDGEGRIASIALSMIDQVDDGLLARLTEIVKSGDQQLISGALAALGKAGEDGLPVLREAALHGSYSTRYQAVSAIGEIGGAEATTILGEILRTGDRSSATAAAQALAQNGGPEARELLIEAALGDRAQISGALAQLAQLEGEDVDQALLSIMKSGSSAERRAALPRLLKAGNEDALRFAIDLAGKGSRNEKDEAMRLLADSASPRAFDALVDIAGKTRGNTRVNALDLLANARPSDPAVSQLLSDSLFSGRRDEANYAAMVLGRIGTQDARDALISALRGNDKDLAGVAASTLGNMGMNEQVKSALIAAARENPAVKAQVMQQLVQSGAPEGLRFAQEMLDSKDPNAVSAIYALAGQGTEAARALVLRAIESKDPSVRMAAISSLMQNPDEHTTNKLIDLTRDSDASVRATALQTLGQIGSERAQQAIIDATRSGKPEDRIAAISGLASMDDPRASQQLAALMLDSDPQVAQTAVYSSYNGGPEVDTALQQILNDGRATDQMKMAAASQLRTRGTDLDDAMEKKVTALVGQSYGGYGYGGYIVHRDIY